jgi:Glycosyl transferases group 1/DUF based on E. rectale Gene description (DUF3880)
MHIAVLHTPDAHTTGNYFRKVLKREHKVTFLSDESAIRDIDLLSFDLPSYVKTESIDLLFCIDPVGKFFPMGLNRLACPTAIYLIDVHQDLASRLRLAAFFDYVFIAQCDYLDEFKHAGIDNVLWLPLACDPDFHGSRAFQEKKYDIGFVGHKGAGNGGRSEVLDILSSQFILNDLNRKYRPEEIGIIYSKSQIIFNWAINGDVNMRVFEALCSGRLLLTNRVKNGLEKLFSNKKHLVIYSNVEELLLLAQYYLDNPEEREMIAQAGQAEILAKHTYQHRTNQILSAIFGSGDSSSSAPARSWTAYRQWEAYAQILVDLRQPLATFRVFQYAFKQGEATFQLGIFVILASLRGINARVPLTPNAMRHRWIGLTTKNPLR